MYHYRIGYLSNFRNSGSSETCQEPMTAHGWPRGYGRPITSAEATRYGLPEGITVMAGGQVGYRHEAGDLSAVIEWL